MGNEAVRSWLSRHAPDIGEQFDLVINTTSMEEALEQEARGDGAAGADEYQVAKAEGNAPDLAAE
jgi:hypothetical protein